MYYCCNNYPVCVCVFDAIDALRCCVCSSSASAGRGRGTAAASTPAEVTACCWDTNTPGRVGLCGADGSFVLANHDHDRGTYV